MEKDNQTPKTKKDTFMERYSSRHPDVNAEDEESFYGGISDDYDQYENENSTLKSENERYRKNESDLIGRISAGEDNGAYLDGMMNGKHVLETAIEIHGRDGLMEYLQDESLAEKFMEADKRHKDSIDKNNKLREESEKNAEQTDADISAAIEAGRFTQEEANEAIEGILDICDGITLNICKPEWIEMWLSAKNHDSDVDNAREEGRMDGVNEGIEKQMAKRKSATAPAGKPSMPVGGGGRTDKEERKRGGSLSSMLMGS